MAESGMLKKARVRLSLRGRLIWPRILICEGGRPLSYYESLSFSWAIVTLESTVKGIN